MAISGLLEKVCRNFEDRGHLSSFSFPEGRN